MLRLPRQPDNLASQLGLEMLNFLSIPRALNHLRGLANWRPHGDSNLFPPEKLSRLSATDLVEGQFIRKGKQMQKRCREVKAKTEFLAIFGPPNTSACE